MGLISLTALIFLAFAYANARSEETVARWQESKSGHDFSGVATSGLSGNAIAAVVACSSDGGCGVANFLPPTPQNSFTVHTAAEINALFAQRDATVAALQGADAEQKTAMGALGAEVVRAVNTAIARMEGQLLTPEARVRISEEISERLNAEVEARLAIRLRSEIAKLEQRISSIESRLIR